MATAVLRLPAGETALDPGFPEEVARLSGQPLELCFQCQKCASGCYPTQEGDYTPNQIMRLIQYGARDAVLQSRTIWLCTSCETCGLRCPNGIRMAEVMDVLREMAVAGGISPSGETAPLFHRLFLGEVRATGRVQETMLMMKFKLRTGNLFSDVDLGWRLFRRGKLPLLPRLKKDPAVRQIFQRTGG
ncbi:heterodisulfide reductase [Desulfofundulus thermobenzoicus]|uniref:Heterodisulfide reductase n=1 Tax=Desulfofundulus thermobenzoicus TaxID=29376 RepID=A0A6N7INH9_9FIRM|nr:4Fe-4S dicluster domain-containing protein [Desulfofundulus thermobenzoicus]MQL51504.1 heterodisulfide reductase [Desulfofundulus thermobenzoicus]HHW42751.1 heterodisulfide reductase [Desulfotomaculum sp.]